MPEEQRVGKQKQHRSDLPGAEGTPVGAYWWHVRINCNDGVLDMHLELRWGVGHVALLIFVFQLYIKLNRR